MSNAPKCPNCKSDSFYTYTMELPELGVKIPDQSGIAKFHGRECTFIMCSNCPHDKNIIGVIGGSPIVKGAD